MELVLLGYLFGECYNLLFGLALILRKRHPFANDLSARLVVFHVPDSLDFLISPRGAHRRTPLVAGASEECQSPSLMLRM
jgi:hypothetical protein